MTDGVLEMSTSEINVIRSSNELAVFGHLIGVRGPSLGTKRSRGASFRQR